MDLARYKKDLVQGDFPLDFPGHFIAGSWYKEAKISSTKASFNPNDGEKLIDVFLERETVAKAVDALIDAKAKVASISFQEKIDILEKMRHLLVEYKDIAIKTLTFEAGKSAWEAAWELDHALRFLTDVCEHPEDIEHRLLDPFRRRDLAGEFVLQPIGPTVAYLPLFTPYTRFVQYFTASVLAGCPLLVVSSMHAVLSGILLGLLAETINMPTGSLNIIFGNFSFLKQLITNPQIEAVIYKGSLEHCLNIRKESQPITGRQLILQSGGKNALVVDESASLDQAVQCTLIGMIANAGQLCTATSRVFVPQSMLQEFSIKLCDKISRLKIGPTDKEGDIPHMGPLYAQKAVEKYLRFQTIAKRESDETLLWGKSHENLRKGFFVTPGVHIIQHFDNNKAYQHNVLMAPDIAIYPYGDIAEAIHGVNMTDAALAVAIIGDLDVVRNYGARFEAPNVVVNMPTVQLEHNIPITGKHHCGGHRLGGKNLLFLLSYPHAVLDKSKDDIRDHWPRVF